MKHEFHAIYPAYNNVFEATCSDCNKKYNSNVLLTQSNKPNEYFCDRCVFIYYHKDCRDIFIERDLKELKEYGKLGYHPKPFNQIS